ncbi:MAG TPA: tRNA (N6-isopentenyl adenosine(37)-C2)-methylthiotransferase MiaB [Planctomycetota bacterium]|nr:tRNA (N6-isopentenyl adenosine(37)-C2)-methylthiotransferase MiaB [Planctomycetota bacterium]
MAHPLKLHVVTFGCQMNKLDSEVAAGHLVEAGYVATDSSPEADVILINTCSVRQHAEDKVWSLLGTLRARKQQRPGLVIGVIGCMAQKEREHIRERMPHVDLVCGPMELDRLPALVEEVRQRHGPVLAVGEGHVGHLPRVVARRPNRFQAFVAIMRGCDNYCAYCVVPTVRGREESRPLAEVAAEVEALVADGVVEVTLLGQNVNSYGRTLGGRGNDTRSLLCEAPERAVDGKRLLVSFPLLLRRLDPIAGLERLRFVTSHPKDATDELFRAMAELPRVCPYLHLPAQSGSNRVLRDMNRRYTREHYLERIARLRETVPGVEVAGDFIVGFPGETDAEFEETVDLVRRVEYQNCFVFKYSPREGTKAAELPDDVPWATKQERNRRLLAVQKDIMRRRNAAMVGRVLDVLVEGISPRDPANLAGRSRANHIVAFPGDGALAGRTVAVSITDSTPLTLLGTLERQE